MRGSPNGIVSVDKETKTAAAGSTSEVITTDGEDNVMLEGYSDSQFDQETQLWKVGEVFNNHYFTIKQYKGNQKKHKATGKYLTANGEMKNPTLMTKQGKKIWKSDTRKL